MQPMSEFEYILNANLCAVQAIKNLWEGGAT